ncbi:MAG: response regulator [Ideonella sp.]|nr:response regulator [Ideonella sp.]
MSTVFPRELEAASTPSAAGIVPRRSAGWWPAIVVALAGLAITGLLWRDASLRAARAAEARFEYRTERIRTELAHHLESYEAALRSLAGLIGARNGFDRSQWRRYFEKAAVDEHYPGRLVIGYVPRVSAGDRAMHEHTARADGLHDYTIRSAGGPARGEYLPMAYMRRIAAQSPIAMGEDLADDPVAADAMARAGRTGQTIMTGPLRASPSQAEADQVWAVIVPVYGGASLPSTEAQRQGAVIGYVVEAFNVMETAGSTLGPDAQLIGMKVRDGTLSLFTCPEMAKELARGFQPTLVRDVQLRYGQRDWSLHFAALPRYLAANETDQPRVVLVSGALVSLLLAGLMGTMAHLRARAVELVAERTAALRAALARSEASESHTRAVVDHAIDAIITIDAQGLIQSFNPAAERIFGHLQQDMVGQNVACLMPPPDSERHDDYLRHHMNTGERRIIGIGREVTGLRKDGSTFPLELGISVMQLGGRRYFCGTLRDITERQRTEQALQQERALLEVRVAERTEVLSNTNAALQQEIAERHRIEEQLVAAREQALQAAEVKAGFLANMSHEIRTPMNAVVGMTALLEETSLNAEQRDFVQTIRVSGDALLAVINDILDFSKVESGMLQLEYRPFEVGACIEDAVDMLAPRAAEKGIDLLYVLADDVPPWIVGDATRLRQVLVNLLSNALKFTDLGEVCLTASLAESAGGRLRLQFAVRDTGIGIPPEQQRQLFKAFSQADSSTTRRYGGTGLGLAICQRLVQLMGGVIGLESGEGCGSTFMFTIEVDAAIGSQLARYASKPNPVLASKRVLLVDDNPTNLHILETQCRRWGLEVSTAASAAEALMVLDRDRLFDGAVLDLHMPGMDGIELARQIRWLCPGSLPALVLLSSGSHRLRSAVADALFAATLAKPVKHTQLLDTLTRVLQAEPDPQAPVESSRRLDPTLAQRLPLNILVAEDSPINQKLAVGILAKLGYAGDVAANGLEALELVRKNHYDLVFMDLQMPEMDGLEATRRILATCPPDDRPRIVAMTANAMAGDRERCMAAGMDDYIAKPILPVDVQALIERVARGSKASPPADRDATSLIDQRTVAELRAIDEPGRPSLLRSLMQDYLAETPGAISEIKRFADRREASLLAQRAHKLAGVSASLGASGINEVCVRIERHVAAGDLTGLAAMIDQLEMRFARTRAEMQRLS